MTADAAQARRSFLIARASAIANALMICAYHTPSRAKSQHFSIAIAIFMLERIIYYAVALATFAVS